MRVWQIIADNGQDKQERRYNTATGILYRQNRSYDLSICFDDFIDRLKIEKAKAKKSGYKVSTKMIDDKEKWL